MEVKGGHALRVSSLCDDYDVAIIQRDINFFFGTFTVTIRPKKSNAINLILQEMLVLPDFLAMAGAKSMQESIAASFTPFNENGINLKVTQTPHSRKWSLYHHHHSLVPA